jgi:phage-related protein
MRETWHVEILNERALERVLSRLTVKDRKLAKLAILKTLTELGPDSVAVGRSKALGAGLYELKVSIPPEVLLRVFFTNLGGRVIVILSAYDKKSNDSVRWQNHQISIARRLIKHLKENGE